MGNCWGGGNALNRVGPRPRVGSGVQQGLGAGLSVECFRLLAMGVVGESTSLTCGLGVAPAWSEVPALVSPVASQLILA